MCLFDLLCKISQKHIDEFWRYLARFFGPKKSDCSSYSELDVLRCLVDCVHVPCQFAVPCALVIANLRILSYSSHEWQFTASDFLRSKFFRNHSFVVHKFCLTLRQFLCITYVSSRFHKSVTFFQKFFCKFDRGLGRRSSVFPSLLRLSSVSIALYFVVVLLWTQPGWFGSDFRAFGFLLNGFRPIFYRMVHKKVEHTLICVYIYIY